MSDYYEEYYWRRVLHHRTSPSGGAAKRVEHDRQVSCADCGKQLTRDEDHECPQMRRANRRTR